MPTASASRTAAIVLTIIAAISAASARSADLNQPVAFDIPAQPLTSALLAFSKQAKVQVIVAPNATTGLSAPAVHATMGADAALNELLRASGLQYREVNGTVTIAPVPGAKTSDAATYRLADGGTTAASDTVGMQTSQTEMASRDGATPNAADELPQEGRTKPLAQVVITGSHIRGIDNSTEPVIVLDRSYIDSTGITTTTGLMQSLPQNFALQNQSGILVPGTQDGPGSQGSSINLRGIGLGTTLTLLNGRRMALGFVGTSPDISAIPLSAIERVDVLTNGASAVYGSDAVGGVVNFVLRHDFNGAETDVHRGWANGLNEDRFTQSLGRTWGTGNAMLSFDYYSRGLLSSRERDFVPQPAVIGSLLPRDKDISVLFSGRQEVSETISVFSDDLYTRRDSFNQGGEVEFDQTFSIKDPQLSVTVGADISVLSDWQVEISGSYANNNLTSIQTSSPGPGGIPDPFGSNNVQSRSSVASTELKADGTLFSLPGGDAKLAIGLDWRREQFRFSETDSAGDQGESQSVRSAFAELNLPVFGQANEIPGIHRLTVSLAGRYDDYSSFGSSFDPKGGIMWEPLIGLRLRGSYGTSYLAPTLPSYSLGSNSAVSYTSVDPGVPAGISTQMYTAGNNPASYTAQKSKNESFGLEFSPAFLPGLHVALDYYHISYRDRIAAPAMDPTVVLSNPASFQGLIIRNPSASQVEAAIASGLAGTGFYAFDPSFNPIPLNAFNPSTVQVLIDLRQRNLSETNTSGLDPSIKYDLPVGRAGVHLGLDGVYILNLSQRLTEESAPLSLVGTIYNPPRWRIRAAIGWEMAGWQTNLFLNHTSSYIDNRQSSDLVPVGSFTTVDGRLAYDTQDKYKSRLLNGIVVSLSALNMFNRNPPHTVIRVPETDTGFDPTNASPLGRLISLDLTKKW